MKEKIIKRSLDFVKKEGLNSFSMRKLASQLAIDPMTIYYYFKNKEDLVSEMVEVVFGKFVNSLNSKIRIGNEDRQLRLFLSEYRNFFIQYMELSLYLIHSSKKTYPSVELLNQLLLNLIVSLNPKINPIIVRDILIDFIHGNALSSKFQFEKKSKAESLRLHQTKFQKSIRILIKHLFR
ncbi:TetR/AcrR family transcriptional regulator (plasmid) [Leptospira sp. WS39.C2]